MSIETVTQETLDLMKKVYPRTGTDLAKTLTSATDFSGYNLEAVARSLVPFDSPERNRIPRIISKTGSVAHFKTIEKIALTGGLGRREGERGSAIKYTTKPHDFPFKTYGVQDGITREMMAISRGFEDDLYAKQHTFALLRMMTEEEKLIIGGNQTAYGTVSAPTVTVSASGGSIAAGAVSVKVCALTVFGAEQGVVFDTQENDMSLSAVIMKDSNDADIPGQYNGITAASAATSATATANCSLICTVTPIKGAVAYAWFAGPANAETLQMVTACSTATLTSIVSGGDAASLFTKDGSGDGDIFDGYIPQIINGGGYFLDANANALTASKSGVKELDDLNAYIYGRYKISPDRYLCGLGAFEDITNTIVSTGGAPILYLNNKPDEKANVIGGYRTTDYVNKATGKVVPMKVHPWLPPSTIIAITETIPYPNSEIPRALEMEMGFDYLAEDYAPQKPTLEFAISAYGCLKMYAPRFCGVITNLKRM